MEDNIYLLSIILFKRNATSAKLSKKTVQQKHDLYVSNNCYGWNRTSHANINYFKRDFNWILKIPSAVLESTIRLFSW